MEDKTIDNEHVKAIKGVLLEYGLKIFMVPIAEMTYFKSIPDLNIPSFISFQELYNYVENDPILFGKKYYKQLRMMLLNQVFNKIQTIADHDSVFKRLSVYQYALLCNGYELNPNLNPLINDVNTTLDIIVKLDFKSNMYPVISERVCKIIPESVIFKVTNLQDALMNLYNKLHDKKSNIENPETKIITVNSLGITAQHALVAYFVKLKAKCTIGDKTFIISDNVLDECSRFETYIAYPLSCFKSPLKLDLTDYLDKNPDETIDKIKIQIKLLGAEGVY